MRFSFQAIVAASALAVLCQCSSSTTTIRSADVIVSVKDQKLGIYRAGHLVNSYKVSTSKFGIGDRPGSNYTPLGKHEVVAKIGHGLPAGAVLKSRQWNGEVLRPNAPGRDPIVSRILWLSGRESANRNAYNRFIYIHGTTEENRLGTPASYGCVRMAARDVIRLFDTLPIGASVVITKESLPQAEADALQPEDAKPVQIPPLTPESKPADGHSTMPVPVLAQQPQIERKPGAGPAPVLYNRPAAASPQPQVAAAPRPSAPMPVAMQPSPPPPTKKRFFGLMGGGSAPPAPAPAPIPAAAAPVQPSKKGARAPAIAAAPVQQPQPAPAPAPRRFLGFGGSAQPAPVPVAVPVPAPAPAQRTVAGPPKATKPVPKTVNTTTKKRPVKKVADDSSDAAAPATSPVEARRSRQSARPA